MINFDEEVKKFRPTLEVDQAEDAIYNNDLKDISGDASCSKGNGEIRWQMY